MKITDISMAIHETMPTYKNRENKRPQRIIEASLPEDSVNESAIRMNLHTGTHMDTPRHMMNSGWTMEDMPLERLITPCVVFDLTECEDCIKQEDLLNLDIRPGDFVLLKTKNSFGLVGSPEFIYIRKDAAEYLVQKGIKGIGTDALGVERDQPGYPTHLTFMNNYVLILEGLDLKNAKEGRQTLIVLPLKILGAEGAPARAVLVDGFAL
ncbi:MAG: cyclase family protein [Bacillota bacterium]|nr:cyclase family protein [Bacillota bacterium]